MNVLKRASHDLHILASTNELPEDDTSCVETCRSTIICNFYNYCNRHLCAFVGGIKNNKKLAIVLRITFNVA